MPGILSINASQALCSITILLNGTLAQLGPSDPEPVDPINLARGSGNSFAIAANGTAILTWGSDDSLSNTIGSDSDVLFTRSTDFATTWTSPALLNSNGATDSGDDGPGIVTTDGIGNWLVAWISTENLGGSLGLDPDIFYARSTDDGVTWTAPSTLNSDAESDSGFERWIDVAHGTPNTLVAVWDSNENVDGSGNDTDILFARSTNGGGTWSAPRLLNLNGAVDLGNDEFPRVAAGAPGNWIVTWMSKDSFNATVGVDYDIFYARSTDNGVTWSMPALINKNGAIDSGDDRIPDVATDRKGNWISVWQSPENLNGDIGPDLDILMSRSSNHGITWSPPMLLNLNGLNDTEGDFVAHIETDGLGNWVVAWYSDDDLNGAVGNDNDVFVSHSKNNGGSWSTPVLLNTNGEIDTAHDEFVQLGTDGQGTWTAIWQSDVTIGSGDGVITYSQFTVPIVNMPLKVPLLILFSSFLLAAIIRRVQTHIN